jgi:uncharacterized membrane protein YphA (DoxX/SURF4 family)
VTKKAGPAQSQARAVVTTGAVDAGDGWVGRARLLAAEWAPAAARVLLGLVLAWFGYHELIAPQLWTGYVPGISATSTLAIILVLVHGWVLLMLAVAITAGVALRLAAAVAALLLVQIVITLTVTGGLTDLTLRDVGVFGLAVCLTGSTRQRAVLTR